MGMTPSFGHPTNPPALRKYWCSEVVDFIFIVQKTTRNVQKSNSTTILQSYQTISRFWAESLDLPQMPADQLAKKLPPEKRHSSLCATESISVEVGNAKDLWKISFVFLDHVVFFGAGGGQPVEQCQANRVWDTAARHLYEKPTCQSPRAMQHKVPDPANWPHIPGRHMVAGESFWYHLWLGKRMQKVKTT